MEIPSKIQEEFILIRAAFENGSITRMSQLEKQKPTRIAELAGINHGRYAAKLFEPWDFSPSEITRIALIINVDSGLIMKVIADQLRKQEIERILENLRKIEDRKANKRTRNNI